MANVSPIFLHSLFRSGSTYLFEEFRKKGEIYCYQEPLHELVYLFREDPTLLKDDHGVEKRKLLRHPNASNGYFNELINIWPSWKGVLNEDQIYANYFSNVEGDLAIDYWKVLISEAKARPLIQECRTVARIAGIKKHIGGVHIYLWRNPRDQWWSYKVTSYFNIVNQIIINSNKPPAPIQILLDKLSFEKCSSTGIPELMAFYSSRPQSSESSYLIFYMLWCLAIIEGMKYSNLLINIDSLSNSIKYKNEIIEKLGIHGIKIGNFENCYMPHYLFSAEEIDFFTNLEEQVHEMLIAGSVPETMVSKIKKIRARHVTENINNSVSSAGYKSLLQQSIRARETSIRLEASMVELARLAQQEKNNLESIIKNNIEERNCFEKEAIRVVEINKQINFELSESRAELSELKSKNKNYKNVIRELNNVIDKECEKNSDLNLSLKASNDEKNALQDKLTQKEEINAKLKKKLISNEKKNKLLNNKNTELIHECEYLRDLTKSKEDLAYQNINELASLKNELAAIHNANHHHWLLSEQFAEELRQYKNSISWRITGPFREITRLVQQYLRSVMNVCSVITSMDALIKWGMSIPRLVHIVHRVVDYIPFLRRALEKRVSKAIDGKKPVVTISLEETFDLNRDLSDSGRRAYLDLKMTLKNKDGKI